MTPQPGWVSEFARPIIDAIANRPPSFQDDFGRRLAGWEKGFCPGSMENITGELVATKCRFSRPNTDYTDVALEVDMHFLEGTPSSGEWALHFRDLGNSGHSVTVYRNGLLSISFAIGAGDFDRVEFPKLIKSTDQPNHILLIAKGNRFSLYMNGQPLYYAENDLYRFGRWEIYVEAGTVAMADFRIWNIPTP